jgi:hypothetical protein
MRGAGCGCVSSRTLERERALAHRSQARARRGRRLGALLREHAPMTAWPRAGAAARLVGLAVAGRHGLRGWRAARDPQPGPSAPQPGARATRQPRPTACSTRLQPSPPRYFPCACPRQVARADPLPAPQFLFAITEYIRRVQSAAEALDQIGTTNIFDEERATFRSIYLRTDLLLMRSIPERLRTLVDVDKASVKELVWRVKTRVRAPLQLEVGLVPLSELTPAVSARLRLELS